jgi:ribosomal protein S18 acetylase RimI-like enzyme
MQQPSHRHLLKFPSNSELAGTEPVLLDAIIMPSARPAAYVAEALPLARQLGCWIIVLSSRESNSDAVIDMFEDAGLTKAIAVQVPSDYTHEWFNFRTSDPDLTGHDVHEQSDLSLKRNIGLALARLLGWKGILYLDDDIRGLDLATVRGAERLLGRFSRVGFRVEDYPDSSVICHANRDLGGEQDVFVGGSALAVDCRSELPFFPHIYNEDWFFLYESALRRDIAIAGIARQLKFDPYRYPSRAASEEFGDVVAEGLIGHLHSGHGGMLPGSDFWEGFLEARNRFLKSVAVRAAKRCATAQLRAVKAAMQIHADLSNERCDRFIRLWQEDLRCWAAVLPKALDPDGRPRFECPESAIRVLGLPVASPPPAGSALHLDGPGDASDGVFVEILTDPARLRSLRLAALKESPQAFASDHSREQNWDAAAWERTLASATWYAARISHKDVGLAGVISEEGRPSWERHLQSMWVRRQLRGKGVGRHLLRRVIADAESDGARLLSMWVFTSNDCAKRFYQELGFCSMEQVQHLKGDLLARIEERLGAQLHPKRGDRSPEFCVPQPHRSAAISRTRRGA